MNKGLYVHIPFCVQKCKYCDFVSYTGCDYSQYIDSLCNELDLWKGENIDTVFIGGGTPTILPPKLIDKLFTHINRTFKLDQNTEWTVEANPKTVDTEKLMLMKSLGVNRISLGVQSFNDYELKKIGRIHTSKEAQETILLIKEYFSNFNLDIISALPDQSYESFIRTIKTAISFDPTHISCYSLILEEGTPLHAEHKKSPLNLPDEDTERDMYNSMIDILTDGGYHQYEISNFSKKGYECKHNLKYWCCRDYIGAGIAAHSLVNGVRNENTNQLEKYIVGSYSAGTTALTNSDKISEYIIMSFRLREGIDEIEFNKRFSKDFSAEYKPALERFISMGLIEKTSSGYRLSREGINVSNSILCEFV
ncbi:MAG: radical SAM family heme chaperone HemW [Clostridia bacterium]|nr:radical SAM family heme chaperone HemW [Clostridia bacterium]